MNNMTKDKTALSLTAASSSTLIGFCVTVITLLITLSPQQLENDAVSYILGFFVIALIFFFFSTEFYILAARKEEKYDIYETMGSIVYGLGTGWLILGVSLTIHIMTPFNSLSYLVLIAFLCGYIIYYILRSTIESETPERFMKLRWITRGLIFGQIIGGILLLNLL